jgi:hypothetical protein
MILPSLECAGWARRQGGEDGDRGTGSLVIILLALPSACGGDERQARVFYLRR